MCESDTPVNQPSALKELEGRMLAEISAGLSSLKAATDILKGLNAANTQAAINEVKIGLQERIFEAHEALTAAQDAQTVALQRVSALEKEVADLKAWDTEKERYELKCIRLGGSACMLKPEARGSEPPHWLCPNCYAKGKKAFFQPTGVERGRAKIYRCQGCQGDLAAEDDPEWMD